MPHCHALTAAGLPCQSPDHMVDDSGYCLQHRADNAAQRAANASLGGNATAKKHASAGFSVSELRPLASLEDAKLSLVDIRDAILTRKVTHTEGRSATGAIEAWIKAEAAALTKNLVNELTAQLAENKKENESLRKQIAENARQLRIAR
jgi:hypothetical protein